MADFELEPLPVHLSHGLTELQRTNPQGGSIGNWGKLGILGKWRILDNPGIVPPKIARSGAPHDHLGQDSHLSALGETAPHTRLRSQEARVARDDEHVAEQGKATGHDHDEPEAVIIPVEEYDALMRIVERSEAQAESVLAGLRKSFDERLALIQDRSAAARLQSTIRGRAKLGGKVKAGSGY